MLRDYINRGVPHQAGAGDRSFSGTARHCENSRAVRSNWRFAAGCITALGLGIIFLVCIT
jgi:hypothetical protein